MNSNIFGHSSIVEDESCCQFLATIHNAGKKNNLVFYMLILLIPGTRILHATFKNTCPLHCNKDGQIAFLKSCKTLHCKQYIYNFIFPTHPAAIGIIDFFLVL